MVRLLTEQEGEHPQAHLKGFSGILQADAYAGYEALYADGQIVEAACWAHARGKFFELAKAQSSPTATEALKHIAALYAIETEVRGQLPQVRQAMRQARAGLLLDEFKDWLTERLSKLSRKSALAEAMVTCPDSSDHELLERSGFVVLA